MSLEVGIIGLPNVGKSTLFNALTASGVAADNYAFTTIDANVGVVPIPDDRLERIAAVARPETAVPATIEFVDIAGLVRGAATGEGLGNRFLGRVREVDAVAHVVRCFSDPDVAHVHGEVDPAADIEVVQAELILADLGTVERALGRHQRRAAAGEEEARRLVAILDELRAHLASGHPARTAPHEQGTGPAAGLHLLTAIPVVYVANIADEERDDDRVTAVREVAAREGAEVEVVSAAFESELVLLDEDERAAFRAELGVGEASLGALIEAARRLLGLGTFFTATGGREARAWTFALGTTASQAAGIIHSDFERGFVRAEVAGFDDYVTLGGEHGAREAGKLRVEGRHYVVRDGDVIRFRFNV